MKKRNGWLYAFWILIIVVLVLALAVGLISWAGSGSEESEGGGTVEENPDGDGGDEDDDDEESSGPTILSVSLSSSTLAFEYSETKEAALTATVKMSDDSEYDGDYAWESSDDSVATVSGTGASATVTAVKCGEATITVSVGEDDDVETAECEVTVSEDHTAAEAARIIGSAEAAEGYNFTFDDADAVAANQAVLFNDSAVHAVYDASSKTYTLSGVSAKMDESQSTAFWGETDASGHIGHEYIGFIVNVNEGETVKVESYSSTTEGAAADKTFTFTDPSEDTSFLVDIKDHDSDGPWYNVITVTYAGGDVEIYYVILGEIFTPASTADDLSAVFASGGNVALTDDITVSNPVEVVEGAEVEFDLAGHTVGLSDSTNYISYTIGVSIGAELTIIDSSEDGSGTVDTIGNNTAALINVGTTVLKGGLFTRSQEAGMEETGNGVGSFYTVVNIGDMTIEDGTTVYNAGDYSSCLINSNGTEVKAVYPNNRTESANLTINGGKIYGGKYSIRNGEDGTLTMTGGTVGGLRSAEDTLPYRAINNYDEATITGGKLLGGNGGAIDIDAGGHANNCTEGVVIFNEDEGTNHTLTIGDENGNGPEIIYEGINPDAATAGSGGQIQETKISYYDGDDGNTMPAFATSIALYSGEVDILGGTIKCSDTDYENDYTFVGVYLTSGGLNVSGGSISGDVAIAIDCTAEEETEIAFSITGGQLVGDIIVYSTDEEGNVVASVYNPGGVTVPSEEFTFNDGTFDGLSGLAEDFTGASGIEYKAGDITVTEIVGGSGNISVVVDGIVANQMSDEQKVAFDASYSSDEGVIRFYIAVEIAVQPGETVTVTSSNGKTDTMTNSENDVQYIVFVIEVLNPSGDGWDSSLSSAPSKDYGVVEFESLYLTVAVTDANNSASSYTITFGNIYLPQQAWNCANGNHAVTQWTVVEEGTCGTAGSQTGICDYCGEEVIEVVSATGNHSWDEGSVTTPAACTTDGEMTYTCTVCGETKTEVIPATGHTATEYDGVKYAVYKNLDGNEEEPNYAWGAYCETCSQWFEIDGEYSDYCIYDFVLVAKDETSLNAAIATAKVREDGSAENRTQIIVYGTITISDNNYVLIDCDNVEIYGLGAEYSKIIDSAYDSADTDPESKSFATSGVEITGKNVTIRDLTIDGSALNDVSDKHMYRHAVEIKGDAANVTFSDCVIIAGGTGNEDAPVCVMEMAGDLNIVNCTLSGAYNGFTIVENVSIVIMVSGGSIEGARGIFASDCSKLTLTVENAEINGKNSFNISNDYTVTFTGCTFGYYYEESGSLVDGSVNTYSNITFINCKFLSHTEGTVDVDAIYKDSLNYVIRPRQEGVTLTFIGCTFENTHEDLDPATLAVSESTFIYLVSSSDVHDCYLYFGDPETSLEYVYDSTAHTVEHNHNWGEGVEDATTGKTTWTCEGCGATKTEITGTHIVSMVFEAEYVVTTVSDETFTTQGFTITMSDDPTTTYTSISEYLAQYSGDTVTWTSSDTSVATVDESGKITIVGAGYTTISVKFEITGVTASYMLCVGEAITDTDPLIGSWHGTDKVTASASFISLDLTVEVYATVTDDGFTLRVVESKMSVDETIWSNVPWFEADDEYYLVVEEADGSYELIDISYDAENDQLSTSFEFSFEYKVFGQKIDVTVDVENATLDRVTADGGDTEPDNQNP